MTPFNKGDIVFVRFGAVKFAGVVAADPWQPSPGRWMVHVSGLGDDYRRTMAMPDKSTARGVRVERLELAPTVYCLGQEHTPDGWHRRENIFEDEFDGEIYWHDGENSLQDAGWKYSLRDAHGLVSGIPAESYESARAAVEKRCK